MKKIRKIIGFDSWTGGARHYERLLPVLNARSIQLTLVHIGSWGNEPGCPRESRIGNLLVRDIAFYGGESIDKILDIEQPDAVVLLSVDTFVHRAFIRYCKQRSIPTLNLYHGMINTADSDVKTGGPTISLVSHLTYILSKLSKLLRYTFPCYIKALLQTKSTCKDWGRFVSDIVKLALGTDLQLGKAPDDAKTSKCAVYVQADAEHAINCYGFNKQDVFVVGCPDFIEFGIKQGNIGQWLPSATDTKKPIMYIETGYSSVGVYFSGTKGFVNHLIETANSLAAQGYEMRLKLKPNQVNIEDIKQQLIGTQIELITNANFVQSLTECSACIVEATTLAILPAFMGMPLLLANYADLRPLSFGCVLTSYPRAYRLQDVSDVSNILLEDAKTSDSDKFNAWIDLNVGPLPPEKMPERVAAIVDDMIASGSQRKFT